MRTAGFRLGVVGITVALAGVVFGVLRPGTPTLYVAAPVLAGIVATFAGVLAFALADR